MSEPTIARGETADLLEQSVEVVPEDGSEAPPSLAWEADTADTLEQHHDVGIDEERDEEHQV